LPPILAHPIQIEQVLVNLLRNAAESMEGLPEAERRIQLRSWPEPQRLVASVCDAGPGISDDGLQHLFEAFYTTKPLGMGIGLAISRRIVEEHGGQLWATRNAARGMTFAFALPLPE
jgi:C4-dicarboxylate-specific signal transduction histidine kinase